MARAGTFRDTATFQRKVESYDDDGSQVGDWEELFTIYADLREAPGREAFAAGVQEGIVNGTLRVRDEPGVTGVTAADRVLVRGRTWNIRSLPAAIDRKASVYEFRVETGGAGT